MPQIQFTIADFNQNSQWVASWHTGEGETYLVYSTPSTSTVTKIFDISTIPAGAIIDSATLSQARNNPYTGIALRQLDGVTWTGTKDVKSLLDAMAGTYTDITFEFKFKANGGAGGAGTRTSTLTLTLNTLTVTYHMPTSTGALDKSTVNAGDAIKITITPAESGRTHKVVWTFGTYTDNSGALAAETLEDTLSVPMAWLNAIPNAVSGLANCRLETYDGATLLGYRDYPFTISCPGSVVPSLTFPAPTHIPYSEGVSEWGYVQGYSKASMAITEAAGAYGSTIVSRNIIGGGYDSGTEDELTTGLINAVGTVTFTARVTDSRGRTKTETQSINVTAYALPAFTAVVTERCTSAGVLDTAGKYARAYCAFGYTAIGTNSVSATVKYRESGTETWSDPEAITSGTAITIGDDDFDTEKAYEVLYTVTDALGSRTYTDYVTKAKFLAEMGNDAVGLLTTYGAPGTVTVREGAVLRNGTTPYVMAKDDPDIRDALSVPAIGIPASNANLNTLTESGMYAMQNAHSNLPSGAGNYGQLLVVHGGRDTIAQFYLPYNGDRPYFRAGNPSDVGGAGSWYPWQKLFTSSSTLSEGRNWLGVGLQARSVSQQSGFSSDTYLSGSFIVFPSAPAVGTKYRLIFDVTKTAAGTATPIITIRTGTAGTTADTSRCALTFGAGTKAVDTGVFEVICVFRTVGNSTNAVIQSIARLTSNLTTTGISNAKKAVVVTSDGFDSTTASLGIGASYNGGSSASHTIELVAAELTM